MSSRIAFSISDRNLTPLLSSSQDNQHVPGSDNTQAQALHALTTTSITAYETARRLGYGTLQRLMIETGNDGPVLLQSYLDPSSVVPRSLINHISNTDGDTTDLLDVGRPSTGISEQTTINELAHAEGSPLPLMNGFDNNGPHAEEDSIDDSAAIQPPPTLFATIVVSRRADLGEGRSVAMRMERLGRQFQREWVREQVAEREQAQRETQTDGEEDG